MMASMSFQPYPLASSALGGGAEVPLSGVSQAFLFSLLGESRLRVDLLPDPAHGGFIVSHKRVHLGRLPQEMREQYPQLDYLRSLHQAPQAALAVRLNEESGQVEATVSFPAPGAVMPQNMPPEEPWALLPEGPPRPLDVTRGDGTALPQGEAPAQWLAQVSIIDGTVVALVQGKVVGPLSAEDSDATAGIIQHFEALGVVPVARLLDVEGGPVLLLRATDECTEEDLEPVVDPLPRLHPYELSTGEFPAVSVGEDGWAITFDAETAATPIEYDPDVILRPITSPSLLAMRPDGTPVKAPQPEPEPEPQPTPEPEPEAQLSEPEPAPETKKNNGGIALIVIGIVLIAVGVALPTFATGLSAVVTWAVLAVGIVSALVGIFRAVKGFRS
ncbi:Uncharacterised protein [Corynebacterium renale]|uniref:Uncharacterized protein n=2 Tax=Corynebacterium renale TaxID=1724 RepID=A0A2A9DL65_9CORY|nr:hypothetical protein ATK06_0548 [Corynebacterium renale]SQI23273.1 Uncharacterised protein [Corynebacterium renale]